MQPALAQPLPVLDGDAPLNIVVETPTANSMLVTQQGQTGIIAWDSFSIQAGNSVHFENGNGATLNRVTGNLASQIDGTLAATGALYLINQNGIAVGNNGMVATGGSFYGSTQALTNPGNIGTGDLTFSGSSEASVLNFGTIKSDQGDVALIARNVDNKGTISALNGTAALLGGYEIVAKLTGDANGKFSVSMGGTWDDKVTTSGIIEAMNVELRAQGGSVEALAGNTASIVKATGVQQTGGRIFLTNDGGTVRVKAPVVAKNPKATPAQNWDGGSIEIAAAVVETEGLLSVAGAGTGNGGTILISGDYDVSMVGTVNADGSAGGFITLDGRSVSVEGTVTASGSAGGLVWAQAETFANTGTISANGNGGGVVVIADTLVQHGTVEANSSHSTGGLVDLAYAKSYVDVASSRTTANGVTGGDIFIRATSPTANHFSSGTISATGSNGIGGSVRLSAGDHLRLVGAMIDVRGTIGGGDIWLSRQGPQAEKVLLAAATELRTNGGTLHHDVSQLAAVPPVDGPFANFELYNPNPASTQFGSQILTLANNNVAVLGGSGAAYLYDGQTGHLLSALVGVGMERFELLKNGNYLVVGSGGVTFAKSETGVDGVVSHRNSLVGHSGYLTVLALKNGNYVVGSDWAVTFGSGTTGAAGYVDASNSLVDGGHWFPGFSLYRVGDVIQELPTGHYVVSTPGWNSATAAKVGAVTFGNGWTGVSGEISALNSLVGDQTRDGVGGGNDPFGIAPGVKILSNGDYVVLSGSWRTAGGLGGRGAVTLGDGQTGTVGIVSSANSLIGTKTSDAIGGSIADLGNGDFVVGSGNWSNGNIYGAGAATLIRKSAGGTFGEINAGNSLVGTTVNESVGEYVVGLTNGNYVVTAPGWDDGNKQNVGAVAFGNGATGLVGTINIGNSLVGTTANDRVGAYGVYRLTTGNYVVATPEWDNGTVVDAGAATWGNGSTGTVGYISSTNSLVGSQAQDSVGTHITPLSDGNYVVSSHQWNNGQAARAGAATWGYSLGGTVGEITEDNSLVGLHAGDHVGAWVYVGPNGTYVVNSYLWNGIGAWTFGQPGRPVTGTVSASNSLVGLGQSNPIRLGDGNVLFPTGWDGVLLPAGSATFFDLTVGSTGMVGPQNSLIGGLTFTGPGTWASLDSGALAGGAYYAVLTENAQTFDEETFEVQNDYASSFNYARPGGRTGILSQQTADIVLLSTVAPYRMANHFKDGSGFIISGGEGRVIVFRTPLPPVVNPDPTGPAFGWAVGQPVERNLRMQVAADGASVMWRVATDDCSKDTVLGDACRFQPHPDNANATGASL